MDLDSLPIYQSYVRSPYLSVKHQSYFQVYQYLLGRYRGKTITFVEVGVLNGGSLFMWRDFFGTDTRIIGIDFNPEAERWTAEGFEIFIGDQASTSFWDDFFSKVGPVDILLDDGGHTNEQQIVTTAAAIPHIKDGGMVLVEDTHTSFMPEFGNPSRYSFTNYAAAVAASLNARSPMTAIHNAPFRETVFSVSFYESIVAFEVDRTKCFQNAPTSNHGITFNARDYRGESELRGVTAFARKLFGAPDSRPEALHWLISRISSILKSARRRKSGIKLRRYFPF